MIGRLKLTGTGGSMGIPVIGCDCDVCRSSDLHNRRMRSGALVTIGSKQILIDAGPDFREQALYWKIKHLDAILMTHCHNDHSAGVDDLRALFLYDRHPIPLYLSPQTYQDLCTRYPYIFKEREKCVTLLPQFDIRILEEKRGSFDIDHTKVHYFTFYQTNMDVHGYRFGDLAYVSDIKSYDDTIFDDLKGVRTLILSALRFTPTSLHFTVDEAVEFAKKAGAEKVWLTHIAHELDHERTNAYLPKNIQLAYDGVEISFKL